MKTLCSRTFVRRLRKRVWRGRQGEDGGQWRGRDSVERMGIPIRTGGRFHFLAFSSQPPDNQDTKTGQIIQVPCYDKRKHRTSQH